MGISSGRGGGGRGGFRGGGGCLFFLLFGRRGIFIYAIFMIVAVCIAVPVAVRNNKGIQEARAELERKLAADAQISDMNLEHFEWAPSILGGSNLFEFTGTGTQPDGTPIDFVKSVYSVSEKNWHKVVTELDKGKIEGLDSSAGFLKMLKEILFAEDTLLIACNTILVTSPTGNLASEITKRRYTVDYHKPA